MRAQRGLPPAGDGVPTRAEERARLRADLRDAELAGAEELEAEALRTFTRETGVDETESRETEGAA